MYVLLFARTAVIFTFALSSVGKLLNISLFQDTLRSFHLYHKSIREIVSGIVVGAEVGVVALLLSGRRLVEAGFVLATILLAFFSCALIFLLAKRGSASCNCFGASKRRVSPLDLLRNALLLLCAALGLTVSGDVQSHTLQPLPISLAILSAIGFVALSINLDELKRLVL